LEELFNAFHAKKALLMMDQNNFVINVQKDMNLQKINKSVKSAKKIILIHYKEENAKNAQNLQCQMKT
jgi:hypothetical protein